MKPSETEYYQARSATEWQLARSAAHPEARRRHLELAERYFQLANEPFQNKCYELRG